MLLLFTSMQLGFLKYPTILFFGFGNMAACDFYYLKSSGCCCFTQMMAWVFLSQHLVLSFRSDRPRSSFGAQCEGHASMMGYAIYLFTFYLQLKERARPHLCMDDLKRPMQIFQQLSLTLADLSRPSLRA